MSTKPQVFNPDNVTMLHAKDGTVPQKHAELITKDIIQNSIIMQLGKYEAMDSLEKEFQYFAEGPGAYWVGEGQKIQTSKPKWLTTKMVAHKIGVIIPVSREYLHYSQSDFFAMMRPRIAEAFYRKFDEACILNVDNPFPQSIEQSVATAKTKVDGAITYDNLLKLEDKLLDNDYEANAFISKAQNKSALRSATKAENGVLQQLFDNSSNTLDGLPVVNLKSKEFDKGSIYAGDFDQLYYGIPYGISYMISDEAQLSTLTNEDGSPVNLFEQELVALRATMDVGLMIVNDEAFAKLGPKASTSRAGSEG